MAKRLNRLGQWIEALFEDHKLVRRALVFWAVWLITLVVLRATEPITEINAAVAGMVGSIVGILATVTAFYIRSRELDDRRNSDDAPMD